MRTTITALLLCGALSSSAQQTNKVSRDTLMPLDWIVRYSLFDKTGWSLYYTYQESVHRPFQADEMSVYTTTWIDRAKTDTSWKGNRAELPHLAKNVMPIARMFDAMTLMGTEQTKFTRGPGDSPINFALRNDTALTVLVRGIYVAVTYNTLKLTARQRAARAVSSILVPSLHTLTENFNPKDYPYVGLSLVYGSKQALDDSPLAQEPEVVTLIVSNAKASEFVKGTLSEDELLDAADIYMSDRDMITEVKKVKLILE